MFWSTPPISKTYEALGAIGDNRIEIIDGKNEAKIYSSSRNKFYTVTWNDDLTQMMCNDNSAYFKGELSYPMIAILMLKDKVEYDSQLPEMLKGIKWKEINIKVKNKFDKLVEFVLEELTQKGTDVEFLKTEITKIEEQVGKMKVEYLGKKVFPPKGY